MAERTAVGWKPGIDRLLIDAALDADLRRRLVEAPEQAFAGFDLTEEEKDLLRRPDHRLLPLLGAALAHERGSPPAPAQPPTDASQPHVTIEATSLPEVSLVLTVVPCAQYEDGRLKKISYAVWVHPLPAGADPASTPPPQEAVFPGEPLTPLYAVIQVSPLAMQDAGGKPLIGLTAAFRQSSNMSAPAPPESAGRPEGSPFQSDLGSEDVQRLIAAVRSASAGERYERLIELMHALRGGESR